MTKVVLLFDFTCYVAFQEILVDPKGRNRQVEVLIADRLLVASGAKGGGWHEKLLQSLQLSFYRRSKVTRVRDSCLLLIGLHSKNNRCLTVCRWLSRMGTSRWTCFLLDLADVLFVSGIKVQQNCEIVKWPIQY
jgi:hypothetical protein